jgi:hemin uptake protein HemP
MNETLLVDECISIHFRFRAKASQKAIRSVEALGVGAPDDEIAKYAEEHNALILTADTGFTSNQILKKNRDVYFVKRHDGSLFHIKVRRIGKLKPREEDPITRYILDTYGFGIVRP